MDKSPPTFYIIYKNKMLEALQSLPPVECDPMFSQNEEWNGVYCKHFRIGLLAATDYSMKKLPELPYSAEDPIVAARLCGEFRGYRVGLELRLRVVKEVLKLWRSQRDGKSEEGAL